MHFHLTENINNHIGLYKNIRSSSIRKQTTRTSLFWAIFPKNFYSIDPKEVLQMSVLLKVTQVSHRETTGVVHLKIPQRLTTIKCHNTFVFV